MGFDVKKIRKEFGGFYNNKPTLYFDSACSTLVPDTVIKKVVKYYESPSCHSRSNHSLASKTSKAVNEARELVQKYLGASSSREIIFTKNTTESINIIANSIEIMSKHTILISNLEHNSNLLPWMRKCQRENLNLLKFEVTPNGDFSLNEYEEKFKNNKISLVATFFTSNVTGQKLPIKEMVQIAHRYGALFLLDAAQSIYIEEIDVKSLNVDFLCFSGHKMFSPSGMGVLYVNARNLDKISPLCIGGQTVFDVLEDRYILEDSPNVFEAGLQNYSGIIGLGEAVKFISNYSNDEIKNHLKNLNCELSDILKKNNIKILGPENPEQRSSICNINFLRLDSHEASLLLDSSRNINVRSGVHCAHSWYREYSLAPSVRISFSIYNTLEEVKTVAQTILQIQKMKN